MKLLYEAWHANELYDWAVAASIVLGVVFMLAAIKYAAGHAVAALAKRTITSADDILAQVIGVTRVWLLLPLAIYAGWMGRGSRRSRCSASQPACWCGR